MVSATLSLFNTLQYSLTSDRVREGMEEREMVVVRRRREGRGSGFIMRTMFTDDLMKGWARTGLVLKKGHE